MSSTNNKINEFLQYIDDKLLKDLVDFLLPLKANRTKLWSEWVPTLFHVLPNKEKPKIDIRNFE